MLSQHFTRSGAEEAEMAVPRPAGSARGQERPGEARGHPGLKNFGWRPILLTFQFWTPDPVVQRE